ncbi:hypothetical protein CAEBREN_21806 [Caenorhabditis brenneri]|uniref:Uncharacterized protein n=1 Tax=Caenorhabditis brenneri TaxID=135651 RepID=G0NUY1_CAEBE|nr:hypothetical protein CAEBREN_21806 [Caenorhabditis brenneri]
MIVVAVLMLVERAVGSINTVKDRKFLRENPKPDTVEGGDNQALLDWKNRRKANKSIGIAVLGSLIRLIQFISFIIGCIFIFGIYSQRDQCDGFVFWTSYIYCVLSIILYVFGVCILGCVCCCLAICNAAN